MGVKSFEELDEIEFETEEEKQIVKQELKKFEETNTMSHEEVHSDLTQFKFEMD